jgi:hypothetical protein
MELLMRELRESFNICTSDAWLCSDDHHRSEDRLGSPIVFMTISSLNLEILNRTDHR